MLLLQNVEENECRRAHDLAIETYINSFDKSTPPEEVTWFFVFISLYSKSILTRCFF